MTRKSTNPPYYLNYGGVLMPYHPHEPSTGGRIVIAILFACLAIFFIVVCHMAFLESDSDGDSDSEDS